MSEQGQVISNTVEHWSVISEAVTEAGIEGLRVCLVDANLKKVEVAAVAYQSRSSRRPGSPFKRRFKAMMAIAEEAAITLNELEERDKSAAWIVAAEPHEANTTGVSKRNEGYVEVMLVLATEKETVVQPRGQVAFIRRNSEASSVSFAKALRKAVAAADEEATRMNDVRARQQRELREATGLADEALAEAKRKAEIARTVEERHRGERSETLKAVPAGLR